MQYENKKWLLHCQCCCHVVVINLIAGALRFCDRRCGWSTLMEKVGCWCTILRACQDQPLLLLPKIQQKQYYCPCCFLQCDIKDWSSCVDDVVVLQLLLAPAMQHKKLVGCCLRQSCVPSLQWTIVFCCCSWQYNITKYAHCHHACNQQCLLLSSLRLTAYVWLLHPCVLQWLNFCCCMHTCNTDTSRNIKNIIVVASLVIRHKNMLIVIASCNQQHLNI